MGPLQSLCHVCVCVVHLQNLHDGTAPALPLGPLCALRTKKGCCTDTDTNARLPTMRVYDPVIAQGQTRLRAYCSSSENRSGSLCILFSPPRDTLFRRELYCHAHPLVGLRAVLPQHSHAAKRPCHCSHLLSSPLR